MASLYSSGKFARSEGVLNFSFLTVPHCFLIFIRYYLKISNIMSIFLECKKIIYYWWAKFGGLRLTSVFRNKPTVCFWINELYFAKANGQNRDVIRISINLAALKLLLLFKICAHEMCEKFVYNHSETIEYTKN